MRFTVARIKASDEPMDRLQTASTVADPTGDQG
jgi:hypothetical protein